MGPYQDPLPSLHGNHKLDHDRFTVGFDTHARWWRWRERVPDIDWKKKGHVIEGIGYRNRREATMAATIELQRRDAVARTPARAKAKTKSRTATKPSSTKRASAR